MPTEARADLTMNMFLYLSTGSAIDSGAFTLPVGVGTERWDEASFLISFGTLFVRRFTNRSHARNPQIPSGGDMNE